MKSVGEKGRNPKQPITDSRQNREKSIPEAVSESNQRVSKNSEGLEKSVMRVTEVKAIVWHEEHKYTVRSKCGQVTHMSTDHPSDGSL